MFFYHALIASAITAELSTAFSSSFSMIFSFPVRNVRHSRPHHIHLRCLSSSVFINFVPCLQFTSVLIHPHSVQVLTIVHIAFMYIYHRTSSPPASDFGSLFISQISTARVSWWSIRSHAETALPLPFFVCPTPPMMLFVSKWREKEKRGEEGEQGRMEGRSAREREDLRAGREREGVGERGARI